MTRYYYNVPSWWLLMVSYDYIIRLRHQIAHLTSLAMCTPTPGGWARHAGKVGEVRAKIDQLLTEGERMHLFTPEGNPTAFAEVKGATAFAEVKGDVKLVGVFPREDAQEARRFAEHWRNSIGPRPNRPDLFGRYRVTGPDAQRLKHPGTGVAIWLLVVTVKHPKRAPRRRKGGTDAIN